MDTGSKDPGEDAEDPLQPAPRVATWRRVGGAFCPALALLGLALFGWPALEGRERAFEDTWNVRVPSAIELVQAVVFLVLLGRVLRTRWSGARERLMAAVSVAPWSLRIPVLVVLVCLAGLGRDWFLVLESATARLRTEEALITTEASLSAEELVEALVRGPLGPPPVVRILDDDPRGHFASYYAYPRLFRMAPEERRWSAHARPNRHWETHHTDPLFQHSTRRPDAEVSRALALELKVPYVEVTGPLRTPPEVHWLRHHELRALEVEPTVLPSYVEAGAALGWLDLEIPKDLGWVPSAHAPGSTLPGMRWSRGTAEEELWEFDGTGVARRSTQGGRGSAGLPDRFEGRLLELTTDRSDPTDSGVEPGLDQDRVTIADLDRDGLVDLFVPTRGEGACLAFLQGRPGEFVDATVSLGLDTAWCATDSCAADFDGDGLLDLLVVGPGGARRFEGLPQGGYRCMGLDSPLAEVPGLRRVDSRDFDNDGDWDLYFTRDPDESIQVSNRLLLNDGSGDFTESTWESYAQAQALGCYSRTTFGDVNGDGYLDFVLTASEAPFRLSTPLLLLHHGGSAQHVEVRPDWDRGFSSTSEGDDSDGAFLHAGTLRLLTSTGKRVLATLEAPSRDVANAVGGPLGVGTNGARSASFRGPDGSSQRIQELPIGACWTPRFDLGVERRIQTHPAALLRPGGGRMPRGLEDRINAIVAGGGSHVGDLEGALGRRRADLEARIDELLAEAIALRFLESSSVPEARWMERGSEGLPWIVPERFMVESIVVRPRGEVDSSLNGAAAFELRAALEEAAPHEARRGLEDVLEVLGVDPVLPPGLRTGGSASNAAAESGWEGWRSLRWQSADWCPPGSEAYYGELLGSKVGSVVGPFPVTVQGGVGGNAFGVLKLHAHQECGRAPTDWFREDWLRHERLHRARARLDEVTGGALSSTEDLGVRRVTLGLRYPVGPMAEAARELGIDRRVGVRLAMERIRREVRLDARLDLHFAALDLGREARERVLDDLFATGVDR